MVTVVQMPGFDEAFGECIQVPVAKIILPGKLDEMIPGGAIPPQRPPAVGEPFEMV